MGSVFKLDKTVSNYAVFGHPIAHSQSPQIHYLFAKQTGIQLCYQAIDVPENDFIKYLNAFFLQSGRGINVTVPHKETAYKHCAVLTDRAKQCGSVNTIWFDDQANVHGDTTDGQGLINDLVNNHQINLHDKKILLLGAGGAARAILNPLGTLKPASILIANRTSSRVENLARSYVGSGNIEAGGFEKLQGRRFDLIINATALSMTGDLPPLPDDILAKNASCYDLMYSDQATVFMQWASKQGAEQVLDGLGMLVEQAAEAFFIWHGVKPDTHAVIHALRP